MNFTKKLSTMAFAVLVTVVFSASASAEVGIMGQQVEHSHGNHNHYAGQSCMVGNAITGEKKWFDVYYVYEHVYMHNYSSGGQFLNESFAYETHVSNYYSNTGASCN